MIRNLIQHFYVEVEQGDPYFLILYETTIEFKFIEIYKYTGIQSVLSVMSLCSIKKMESLQEKTHAIAFYICCTTLCIFFLIYNCLYMLMIAWF